MIKALLLVLAFVTLTGCRQVSEQRGQARIELFRQCMELAAKIPRSSDDNVAGIINACSNKADYLTFQIK